MKKLIITEKPSVARDIAKVLNIRIKKDGYMESQDYVITWAIGHLITLCDPDDYEPTLKKWNYDSLPIIPNQIKIKPYDKTVKQLNTIASLCKRSDVASLICATDSGREGELIFRYIYQYVGVDKPFQRLWISSMTDEAITDGFSNLKNGQDYDSLYRSARCRAESDWLVGINATRAYTTRNDVLLSIGRVQTPTLALIVNKYHEIQNFVPQDYYEIEAFYDLDFNGTWFDQAVSETKLFDQAKAEQIAQKVTAKTGKVIKVEKSNGKEKPPLLYDLTELQRDGNKLYGYTANKVLEIAQSLYERKKLITYPRTDSRYISDDMKKTVIDTMYLLNIPPYDRAISALFKDGQLHLKFNKRIVDNSKITDHTGIIPSKKSPANIKLSVEEQNIYNLIVKRFIAVFYEDFTFSTTKITVEVETETFLSKGKIIKNPGWKKLYQKSGSKGVEDVILPEVKKNQEITVVKTQINAKQTTPPKPYTDATLLSAMENAGRFVTDEELKEQLKESGFGTPATRASIIERLIKVKYIYRKGKSLFPTEKGIKLVQIIPPQLKSPDMTGRWERGLTKISKNDLDTEVFMSSIHKFVRYLVNSADKTRNQVRFEPEQRYQKKKR